MTTPQSNNDVAELRKDALNILLFIMLILWVSLLVTQLLYCEIIPKANLSLAPILVLLGALVTSNWLRRGEHIESSAWVLVGGLVAAPGLFLALHGPSQFIYFCFTVPVVAASIIVGGKAEFWVSGLIAFIMLTITLWWQTSPDGWQVNFGQALGITVIPALTNMVIASIVHLNYHNILTMVQWAVDSQQKDAQRSELLYNQQQQLKRTMLQLERANVELQLVNVQLSEARKASDIANQHKTQFLANVSHELRSPLNLILSYSQAVLEANQVATTDPDNASARLKRDLQHISRNSEHLNRLIDDLLDVSRAEMNVLELFSQTVEPTVLIKETFCSVTDRYRSNNASPDPLEWHLQLASRLPSIQADPVRLSQIIINLLNNAARFTSSGHITLGAEVTLPHLHIWVEDSGSGIPVDQQELIFEPFVSGKTLAGRPNSIGLGLSIVRHLVALHKGLLTLESQVGKGSVFHVYLPLPVLETEVGCASGTGELANFKPEVPNKILEPVLLLVSVSPQITSEIVELSERQKLPLVRVNQATDWPTLLTQIKPAGLVWELHETNPSEPLLLQQLRTYPQLNRIPIVFYRQAAILNNSDEVEAELEVGLTDFVLKPLSSAVLINTVYSLQPTRAIGPILIVDDDLATCKFYSELLTQAFPNCQIKIAHDGQMAQKIIVEQTPCLILLDLMMPVMDGFSFLEYVRTNVHTRQTPVLVLSGQVLKIEDVARLNYSHLTFQSKEILSQEEIKTELNRILEGKKELSQPGSSLVKKAIAYLQHNYAEALTRQQIASFVEVNERYLTALFRSELGISPWDYLNRYRIKQAKWLLLNTTDSITLIANQVGFNDGAYFSRVFHKEVGMSPRLYREKFI